jgi:hypothetical protein
LLRAAQRSTAGRGGFGELTPKERYRTLLLPFWSY